MAKGNTKQDLKASIVQYERYCDFPSCTELYIHTNMFFIAELKIKYEQSELKEEWQSFIVVTTYGMYGVAPL